MSFPRKSAAAAAFCLALLACRESAEPEGPENGVVQPARPAPLPVAEPRVSPRRATSRFSSPFALLGILVRQACHELRVRRLRGIAFRTSQNAAACRAYAELRLWEFEGINERQAWANWRTIRRNLQGRAPSRPVTAIDLCCGTGDSTEVLASCLEAGSDILGVDADPRFVAPLRKRLDAVSTIPENVDQWAPLIDVVDALANIDSPEAAEALFAFWQRVGAGSAESWRRLLLPAGSSISS